MAFSSKLLMRKEIAKGLVAETYSYNGASVVTGTITPDTNDVENYGIIKNILWAVPTDDATAGGCSVTYANNLLSTAAVLTFTSNDTGKITIVGLVA